jgi:hypothetical protein
VRRHWFLLPVASLERARLEDAMEQAA